MKDYHVTIRTFDKGSWTFSMNQDTRNRLSEAIARGNRFFSFTDDETDVYVNLDNVTLISSICTSGGEGI